MLCSNSLKESRSSFQKGLKKYIDCHYLACLLYVQRTRNPLSSFLWNIPTHGVSEAYLGSLEHTYLALFSMVLSWSFQGNPEVFIILICGQVRAKVSNIVFILRPSFCRIFRNIQSFEQALYTSSTYVCKLEEGSLLSIGR